MRASACSATRPEVRRGVGLVLLGLLVLGGCASAPQGRPLPPMQDWATRQQVLGGLATWSFSGRLALKAGDDGFNGRIGWSQSGEDFSVTVGGPLGVGTVRIDREGGQATLTDKDGTRVDLADAERELLVRYGWTLPVDSLRYWTLGIPDPALPAETLLDGEGRLKTLRQSGWTVAVARYRDGGGQLMPRILTVQNADTRVRMVIDGWLFGGR